MIAAVTETRVCTRCGKLKPADAFYRRARGDLWAECRACARIRCAQRRRTQAYRQWLAAYLARPEVIRRRRRQNRQERTVAYKRTWARQHPVSQRTRLIKTRSRYRRELAGSLEPARRERVEYLLGICQRELARMDARAEETTSP